MIICSLCKGENEDSRTYCKYCGTVFNEADAPAIRPADEGAAPAPAAASAAAAEKNNPGRIKKIVCAGVLAVLAVLLIILFINVPAAQKDVNADIGDVVAGLRFGMSLDEVRELGYIAADESPLLDYNKSGCRFLEYTDFGKLFKVFGEDARLAFEFCEKNGVVRLEGVEINCCTTGPRSEGIAVGSSSALTHVWSEIRKSYGNSVRINYADTANGDKATEDTWYLDGYSIYLRDIDYADSSEASFIKIETDFFSENNPTTPLTYGSNTTWKVSG